MAAQHTHFEEAVTIATTAGGQLMFPNAPDNAKRALVTILNSGAIAFTMDGSSVPVYGTTGQVLQSGGLSPFEFVIEGGDLKTVKAIASSGGAANIYVSYVG